MVFYLLYCNGILCPVFVPASLDGRYISGIIMKLKQNQLIGQFLLLAKLITWMRLLIQIRMKLSMKLGAKLRIQGQRAVTKLIGSLRFQVRIALSKGC